MYVIIFCCLYLYVVRHFYVYIYVLCCCIIYLLVCCYILYTDFLVFVYVILQWVLYF